MFQETNFDSENKIWSVPKKESKINKEASIGELAFHKMRSMPADAICQISDSEQTSLTFKEAIDYAVLIAEHLKNLGITEQDVVGIVAPNTTFLLPLVVGCWLNCTPYHALNPSSEEDIISHLYNITQPKLIFCDGDYYKKIKSATKNLEVKFFTVCNHLEGVPTIEEIFKMTECPKMYQPVPLKHGGSQTMAFYNTSGTTGLPKCVAFPNFRIVTDMTLVDSSTIFYSTSELYWGTAILSLVLATLCGVKSIISTKPATPEYILEILKKYMVTFVCAVPMSVVHLSNLKEFTSENLPKLEIIFMTGSMATTATLKRLKDKVKDALIMQFYGTTEAGSITINLSCLEMGVLGKLMSGVELSIIDPETKNPMDYEEKGEICVRHGGPWNGYFRDNEATRELIDEQGWIHTGDQGYMDRNNVLHFCDRYKEVMKYNGYQFSPNDIELTIHELPAVIDVCVFGVYDERFGDLAAAAIVRSDASLTENGVIEYVDDRQKLEYKRLHFGVFFVEKIERNSTGKVLRNKMRDLCLEQNGKNKGN